MADEGDSLGGRLGRYARVGASVGGLAAKLAGQRYLGLSLDRDKHATDRSPRGAQPLRLKNCTARSCFFAAARLLNVPRLRRFPVFGLIFRE